MIKAALILAFILTSLFSPLAKTTEMPPIPAALDSDDPQETIPASPETATEKDNLNQIESAKDEPEIPKANELRTRDLGDAFKIFKPSEAISADNAVPFPIDI